MSDDEKCPDCEWNEHDHVVAYCEPCKKDVDAMITHLIAAKVERQPGPRGSS